MTPASRPIVVTGPGPCQCAGRGVLSWETGIDSESARDRYRDVPCPLCRRGMEVMGVPLRFRDAHVTDFEELPPAVKEWPAEGLGWYLVGKVGRGKTHLAAALCRRAAERQRIARFYNVVEYLQTLRDAMDDGEAGDRARAQTLQMQTADVVVLDDLGGEYLTGWAAEQLYRAVNRIYEGEGCLIVTSNLNREQHEARLDPRTFSRILGLTNGYELGGRDRRLLRPRGGA